MKKTIFLLIAGLILSTSAFAAEAKKNKGLVTQADAALSGQGYGLAGCGLGSVLLGDQKGIVQVFAATTNGTFYSQTFGITTGTSNCDAKPNNKVASVNVFVAANRQALTKDAARGTGESVVSLSHLTGCNAQELGSQLQSQYGKIFGNSSESAEEVSTKILRISAHCGA